ncbi:MAG: M15 family metallopeptidase, partial [Ruminococcus sp.]
MMKTIELKKEKVYCGNLLLVNAEYPLKNNNAESLIPADIRFPDILMKRDAAYVLQLVLEKICAGNSIVPVSGYRSLDEQFDIWNVSLRDNGEDFTRKYVALPNHSEHQTGLAIDLGLNEKEIDFIRPDFPYVGICNEFRKAAPDYGFIERYAKDKEEITGISHEPWHFRYVGYPHSKIMQENGFSLEEYT